MTVWINKITVELQQECATDRSVVAAARVSTTGSESRFDWSHEASAGLIRYLMANRHGTPFEHTFLTFYVHAPIFVYREWHRHRIGVSINEESGRYKELEPVFYLPPRDRPGILQVPGSKPGQYHYEDGTEDDHLLLESHLKDACYQSYSHYSALLEYGIAKEVARMCLPVNIYSSMYWSCNARSLMSFLSLRQKHTKREPTIKWPQAELQQWPGDGDPRIEWEGEAFFPSKPQWEINVAADALEQVFATAMPITHRAFVEASYVAP